MDFSCPSRAGWFWAPVGSYHNYLYILSIHVDQKVGNWKWDCGFLQVTVITCSWYLNLAHSHCHTEKPESTSADEDEGNTPEMDGYEQGCTTRMLEKAIIMAWSMQMKDASYMSSSWTYHSAPDNNLISHTWKDKIRNALPPILAIRSATQGHEEWWRHNITRCPLTLLF